MSGIEILQTYIYFHKLFQIKGWLLFLQKFQAYNEKITREFSQKFDGRRVSIGEIQMEITEYSIAQDTKLRQVGDKLFKNNRLTIDEWKKFLVNSETTINWSKGIPVVAMKSKWNNVMFVFKKYITFKGRCGLIFYYHLHILLHFVKGHEVNMPFFLLSSLKKWHLPFKKDIVIYIEAHIIMDG